MNRKDTRKTSTIRFIEEQLDSQANLSVRANASHLDEGVEKKIDLLSNRMISGEENISSESLEDFKLDTIKFKYIPSIIPDKQLTTPFKQNKEIEETIHRLDNSYCSAKEESIWNNYEDIEDFPVEQYKIQNAHWVKAKNIEPKNYKVSVFADDISHDNVMYTY